MVLVEAAVDLESRHFQGTKFITTAETITKQAQLVNKRMKNDKEWMQLDVSDAELDEIVRRKLRAKEFINFKINSSTIPISDKEAEEYFKSNRSKFENLPFESFKENIKSYLTKQQLDRRMKDWFEFLQNKYHVRNYLSE